MTSITVARPFPINSIQTNLDTMIGLAYSIVHSNGLDTCVSRLQTELSLQLPLKNKTTVRPFALM